MVLSVRRDDPFFTERRNSMAAVIMCGNTPSGWNQSKMEAGDLVSHRWPNDTGFVASPDRRHRTKAYQTCALAGTSHRQWQFQLSYSFLVSFCIPMVALRMSQKAQPNSLYFHHGFIKFTMIIPCINLSSTQLSLLSWTSMNRLNRLNLQQGLDRW